MELDDLDRRLMEAAIDPSQWTDAMARDGNAVGATLIPLQRGTGFFAPVSSSLQATLQIYIKDGWYQRDKRDKGIPLLKTAGLCFDQDFASEDDLKRSDYYRGFLAAFESNWSASIGISVSNEEWCLGLQRGDRHGPYQPDDRERLLKLGESVRRAALVSHHLSYGKAIGMGDAFDVIGCASILIDNFGNVLRCNREAEKYIPNDFRIVHRELYCRKSDETDELRKMIGMLCNGTNDLGSYSHGVLVSRSENFPFMIQGVTLQHSLKDIFTTARALLFVVDPLRDRPSGQIEKIARMFKMTRAESALLSLLERDVPLPEAAEQLGISYETARTQLKSLFNRTDTKRQSELIGLVHRLGPNILR
jgi:DNA-binding CsgD family transcriptional regulator